MKVFFFSDGSPNQVALAAKLSEIIKINTWIVYSPLQDNAMQKCIIRVKKLIRSIVWFSVESSWIKLQKYYSGKIWEMLVKPTCVVQNINDDAVISLVRSERPDLVMVSGTNLLKSSLITEIKIHGEIINLHTGLSPYVNGGPNCTNWCLYKRDIELIGVTVMFLNEGIDTGDVIASKAISIKTVRTPLQLHLEIMNQAHELLAQTIKLLISGVKLESKVQKDFEVKSVTYFRRDWSFWKAIIAYLNFYSLRYSIFTSRVNSKRRVKTVNLFEELD